MPNLTDLILDAVNQAGYQPVKAKVLSKKIGVRKKEQTAFFEALQELIDTGRIHQNKKGLLRLKAAPGLISGIIKRTERGSGFCIPHEPISKNHPPGDRKNDIYIAPEDMRDAHTGDEVLVRLTSRRRQNGQRCGRIEQVIERASTTFVGTYFEQAGQSFVQVDGKTFGQPIWVGDPGAKMAVPEDKVVIDMLRFPTQFQKGEAVLVKVLGPKGNPEVDTLSIIHEFGLPLEFPEEVLEEARQLADGFDENNLPNRTDLTGETIVTIDPVDARDFDDAISLKRTDDGHWHLGVHIADVSHFVTPDSLLDQEGYQRGNSVYLPGRVIPMLPEVLSNGLCSLQKGRIRLAKTAFLEFTADGVPVHTEFANSIIKVTRRFAYEEVMPIINHPEQHKTKVAAKIRKLLAEMYELAMLLRKRRFVNGALELHLPEVKLELNSVGQVSGAKEAVHDESHEIIEEFMLAANVAVAQALTDRGIPFLRREHGDPDYQKLKSFAEFVKILGYSLEQFQSRPALQKLIKAVHDQPVERAVNFALLRSMKQAEYSGNDEGHYALAEENYCHFTSPIRRYPDLLVHRLIDQIVFKKKNVRGPSGAELAKIGKHCSTTERRAEKAERELIQVKLLQLMEDRIGEEINAVITGVEQFGLFCQGEELPLDGLLHISALLPEDNYYHDRAAYSLIGRQSGTQFQLGGKLRVKLAHVDVDRRELDFRLAEEITNIKSTHKQTGRKKTTDAKQTRTKKQGRQRKVKKTRHKKR